MPSTSRPLPRKWTRWVGQFDPLPSTILKIAARIKSWRDLQQLAALLVNHPDWPLAVMGLGPYAAQSRSVLTALGSRLVYGYLDQRRRARPTLGGGGAKDGAGGAKSGRIVCRP